jgi:hypothetical protein
MTRLDDPRVARARSLMRDALTESQGAATSNRRVDPYAEDTRHSFFKDLLVVAEARARRDRAVEDPVLRGRGERLAHTPPGPSTPSVREAQARLDSVEQHRRNARSVERRDLSTTSNAFVPQNLPASLAARFATAARIRSVLPDILGSEPIPDRPRAIAA